MEYFQGLPHGQGESGEERKGRGLGPSTGLGRALQHALSPFFALGLFVPSGTVFLALPAFLGHGFPGAPERKSTTLPALPRETAVTSRETR